MQLSGTYVEVWTQVQPSSYHTVLFRKQAKPGNRKFSKNNKSIKISLVLLLEITYYLRLTIIGTRGEEQGGSINQPDNETVKRKRHGKNHAWGFIVHTGVAGLCHICWLSNFECRSPTRSLGFRRGIGTHDLSSIPDSTTESGISIAAESKSGRFTQSFQVAIEPD